MSDTKHTPGPLQCCFEGSTAAFIVEADGSVVVRLSVTMNSTAHSTLVANTRLFAAAPELLKSLERCFGIMNNGGTWSLEDQAAARAAITKAKGEQP